MKTSFKPVYSFSLVVFSVLMIVYVTVMLDGLGYAGMAMIIFWWTFFLILAYIPYKISRVFGYRVEELFRKKKRRNSLFNLK